MSCERYRDWMTSAAADELPESRAAELQSHVHECAACRQELQRVRTLFAAIDLGVTAQTAAEHSPRLMEQVRQRIRDQASVTPWWNARWVQAVACAAVLVVAASIWTLWPRTGARHELTASSARPSPVQAVRPAAAATEKPKITPQRHGSMVTSMVALARPVRKTNARRIERQRAAPEITEVPEVIVQPGQMEAVMRFAQALNSRQIDGAKLLADLKAADQPLDIRPLKTPELADDKASGTSEGGSEKNFIRSKDSR